MQCRNAMKGKVSQYQIDKVKGQFDAVTNQIWNSQFSLWTNHSKYDTLFILTVKVVNVNNSIKWMGILIGVLTTK